MAYAKWKRDARRPNSKPVLIARWRGADGQLVEERRPNDRTKKQALEYARECERTAELRRKGLVVEVQPVLFGKLWDSWWELVGSRRRSQSKHAFRASLQKHLAGLRGFVLTPGSAGAFASKLEQLLADRQDAAELGPKSLNHLRSGVFGMFEHAKDPKVALWVGENPIRWVAVRKVPRSRKETLAHHEVRPVLDAFPAPQLGGPWRWAAAICLYTGARPGEAFGLHKHDVDLDRGEMTLRYSWASPMPKDDEPRTVLIVPELRPYLEAAIAASPTDLVVPREDGSCFDDSIRHALVDKLRGATTRAGFVLGFLHCCRRCKGRAAKEIAAGNPSAPDARATLKQRAGEFSWRHADAEQRACTSCGMKLWAKAIPRPIRFYDLRHTHATLLLGAGVGIGSVSKGMGHSDTKITANTYDHSGLEGQRAEFGRVLTFNGKEPAKAGEGRGRGADESSRNEGPEADGFPQQSPGLQTVGKTGFEPATPWSRRVHGDASPGNTARTEAHRLDDSAGWVDAVSAQSALGAPTVTEERGAGGARTSAMARRARMLSLRFRLAGGRR